MPEYPKQKTSLLPFPETRNHEVSGQKVRRMAPSVIVFVTVVINNIKQTENNAYYGNGMNIKGTAAQVAPIIIRLAERFAFGCHKIGQRRYNCRHKRYYYTAVAQVTDERIYHCYI